MLSKVLKSTQTVGLSVDTITAFLFVLFSTFLFYALKNWGIDFTFGYFFERRFVIPLGYWIASALYLLLTRKNLLSELRGLLFLHLVFLLGDFLESHISETLTTAFFVLYAEVAARVALIVLLVFSCLAWENRIRKKEKEQSDLFLFFPLAAGLSLSGRNFLLIFLLAMAGYVFFRLQRERLKFWFFKLKSNDFSLAASLYLLGLFFRLPAAYRLGKMGAKTVIENAADGLAYHNAGLEIVAGRKIDTAYSMGESLWMAFLFVLSNKSVLGALLLQACFQGTTVLFIYYLSLWAFGRRSAIFAALLTAFSQPVVYNAANIAREGTALLVASVVLFSFFHGLKKWGTRSGFNWMLMVGVVTGYAYLVEAVFLPALALVFGISLILAPGTRAQKVKVTLALGITALVSAFCLKTYLTGVPGLLGRKPFWIQLLLTEYSSYGAEMSKRSIGLHQMILEPNVFFSYFVLAPWENIVLISKKVSLDFIRYFFEASEGKFDPTGLVRNSRFAATLYVYGICFTLAGILLTVKDIFVTRTKNIFALGLLLFPLAHAFVYIFFLFGYARFRNNVIVFLLCFMGLGLARLLSRTSYESSGTTN